MTSQAKAWREVSLGEICEFKYGKSLPDGKRAGGDVPVYGSNGVVGWHNEALSDGTTIVIGRKGSFGEVNFSPVSCWPIDTTYYIDNSATEVDLKWLAYLLPSLGLTRLNRAAAIPGLNREDAYRQRLLLPPLQEQQRIADILDRAESLRAKRRAALDQLDELIEAIFIDMFGDLIENPRRWDIKKIGDIAEVKTGGTPSRSIEEYWQNGTLPWVKTTEIKENIIYKTEEFISESGLRNSNAVLIPQNSILIAMYGQGTTRGRTAKLGIQAATNQACAAILPSKKYETDFLWTFLRLSYDALRNLGRGGNQPNLNLSMVKDFKVYLPPIEKQKEFSKILVSVERIKQSQNQSLLEINSLFDSLSHAAFTGKLFSNQFFEREIENGVKI